jgi:hypothetical protein
MSKSKKTKKAKEQKTLDPTLPVFQLTITLENIEPPIWRKIQTPDCSLADLHEIIQSCMDWTDEHMYAFEIEDDQYTDLGRGADPNAFEDSRSMRLSDLVEQGELDFVYEYDFGDCWRHLIEIEHTLPAEDKVLYPRCLDGRRACPPEDCGGPYGYNELLDELASRDRGEEVDEERLAWLGDFQPEAFNLELINHDLLRVRRWIGDAPGEHGQEARFSEGDRIRAKSGVVHSEYPDIPLGGWVGTVTRVAWLVPVGYAIRWSDETLAAAHPVYAKRCRRDGEKPAKHWLNEDEMELDSPEQPAEMEQPVNLVAAPLSADDEDDRIRMIFGLTSDDPLPAASEETQRQYRDYLKAHMTFPFNATFWDVTKLTSSVRKLVVATGFVESSPLDPARGILCETHCGQETDQLPLDHLQLDEDDPNYPYLEDYRFWHAGIYDFSCDDEEEDDEDVYGYDELDEEDDWHGDDERGYEDEEDDEDLRSPLGDDLSDLQPIRRAQPLVGRNDPCPCGSGKKFKKCCLKKQSSP